jgi:hypothetical protein
MGAEPSGWFYSPLYVILSSSKAIVGILKEVASADRLGSACHGPLWLLHSLHVLLVMRSEDTYPPVSITLSFTGRDVALSIATKCSVVSWYVTFYIKELSIQ